VKSCWTACADDELFNVLDETYHKVRIGVRDPLRPDEVPLTRQFLYSHVAFAARIHRWWSNYWYALVERDLPKFANVGYGTKLKIVHSCGHKMCCNLKHLSVKTVEWNAQQDHCHYFIKQMIKEYGAAYQSSEKFKTFRRDFCVHKCI